MTETGKRVMTNISLLQKEELELVMAEVKECLRRTRQAEQALDFFVGTGTGFWKVDAQTYVNELRI